MINCSGESPVDLSSPYSPELNPTEILWHELREKFCSNRVFDTLDAVVEQIKKGLKSFSDKRESVTRLSGWPWIVNSILLNAIQNNLRLR